MDGVYICDSRNENIAAEHISFRDLASRGASPMDMMAMTFCEENMIPGLLTCRVVFNLFSISRFLILFSFHFIYLLKMTISFLIKINYFLQLSFSIFMSLEIYQGHYVENRSVL